VRVIAELSLWRFTTQPPGPHSTELKRNSSTVLRLPPITIASGRKPFAML
jgi:hypothetical protein